MSLRRSIPTNPNAEGARSPLENDSTPTSNDTTAHAHTDGADSSPNDRIRSQNVSMPGLDFGMLPNKTESSSLTDTLGVAETSEVTTPRYSKRLSGKFSPPLLIC